MNQFKYKIINLKDGYITLNSQDAESIELKEYCLLTEEEYKTFELRLQTMINMNLIRIEDI